MLPDRVSNPGPLTYESGALPIALRGPAIQLGIRSKAQVLLKFLSQEELRLLSDRCIYTFRRVA